MPILREQENGLAAGFEHIALGPLVFEDIGPDGDGNAPATISFSESGYPETLHLLPEEPTPIAEFDSALAGQYFSGDARADVSIRLEDEKLIFAIRGDYSGPRKFQVEAYTEEAFGVRNLDDPSAGCAMTIRQRDESGKILAFDINTVRSRHLRFERTGDID